VFKLAKSTNERRQYPRFESFNLISFFLRENGMKESDLSMARSLNISAGGVGMEFFEPIKIGAPLEIEIAVKDRIFPFEGRVVHSQGPYDGMHIVGVSFEHIEEELLKKILLL
jgi:hypothetical protein